MDLRKKQHRNTNGINTTWGVAKVNVVSYIYRDDFAIYADIFVSENQVEQVR